MASITSANATLVLVVDTVFPTPVQIQGFGVEDIYDTEDLEIAITKMGVDGVLSAGFVFNEVKQTITLQADSTSNALFDAWNAAQLAAFDIFRAKATVTLPGLGLQWTQTRGVFGKLKPLPDAGKTLKERKFMITWERVIPTPL